MHICKRLKLYFFLNNYLFRASLLGVSFTILKMCYDFTLNTSELY